MDNKTIKDFLELIFENKKKIIVFVSTCSIVAFIYLVFIATHYYESIARIYPVQEVSSIGKNNLIDNPMLRNVSRSLSSSNNGVNFYIPDLVKSDMIKRKILDSEFSVSGSNDKVNLIDYWDMRDSLNPTESFYQAKSKLNKLINVAIIDEMSALVTISVETEDPVLSADINYFLVDEIKNYIIKERANISRQKGKEIQKIKNRYSDILVSKEEELKQFELKNYSFIDDPVKQLEKKRLERSVAFADEVFSFLTFEHIQTEIEQNSNQAIHVLDVADISTPDSNESYPPKKLLFLLTVISSFFGYVYYLLLRKKFEQKK